MDSSPASTGHSACKHNWNAWCEAWQAPLPRILACASWALLGRCKGMLTARGGSGTAAEAQPAVAQRQRRQAGLLQRRGCAGMRNNLKDPSQSMQHVTKAGEAQARRLGPGRNPTRLPGSAMAQQRVLKLPLSLSQGSQVRAAPLSLAAGRHHPESGAGRLLRPPSRHRHRSHPMAPSNCVVSERENSRHAGGPCSSCPPPQSSKSNW